MENQYKSADDAYYRSRVSLGLRATREGRKNPAKAVSYHHKPGESAVQSSDKYYASLEPVIPAVPQPKAVQSKQQIIQYSKTVLQSVIVAFSQGCTSLQIEGTLQEIRSARASIDLAVGRNTLTRKQADAISFVVCPSNTFGAEDSATSAPEIKEAPQEAPQTAIDQLTQADSSTVASALQQAPVKKSRKKKAETTPAKEDLVADYVANYEESSSTSEPVIEDDTTVTEDDIRQAFNAVDDGDD